MPLENRNLEAGTVLRARFKGKERTCEVAQTADGLRYRLDDGREFTSPSSAGKAAMDGVSCNGWRFWIIEGAEKSKRQPRGDKAAKAKGEPVKAKAGKSKAARQKSTNPKRTEKGKAMRAAAKSGAPYRCGACGETFPTKKAVAEHATEAHLG